MAGERRSEFGGKRMILPWPMSPLRILLLSRRRVLAYQSVDGKLLVAEYSTWQVEFAFKDILAVGKGFVVGLSVSLFWGES